MSAPILLLELIEAGVRLSRNDEGNLRVETGRGVLTDDLRQRLREAKPELLELLETQFPGWRDWRLTNRDGVTKRWEPVCVTYETLLLRDGVTDAVEVPRPTRLATRQQAQELRGLIQAIYAPDGPEIVLETLTDAIRDAPSWLTYCRSLFNSRALGELPKAA